MIALKPSMNVPCVCHRQNGRMPNITTWPSPSGASTTAARFSRCWPLASVPESSISLALDGKRLRFALWRGSRTAENLTRGGRALFCHVAPRTVVYVRGAVRALDGGPELNLDCFELAVESVESDDHAGMPVTTGITFAVERDDPAVVVAAWERQLAGLRAAT